MLPDKQKKESLRTTIPMSIVKQWNLTEDDYLGWQLEYDKSRKKIVAVVIKDESVKLKLVGEAVKKEEEKLFFLLYPPY